MSAPSVKKDSKDAVQLLSALDAALFREARTDCT